MITLVFGLIHGFGFAANLLEMPQSHRGRGLNATLALAICIIYDAFPLNYLFLHHI